MLQIETYDVVFIVGLPGSGKTYLASAMCLDSRVLIDDPKRAPKLEPGVKYAITDPHLCNPETFLQVSRLYPSAFYYLFENDIEQCWSNIQKRGGGRNITYEYLLQLSSRYNPHQLVADCVHDGGSLIKIATNSTIIEVYHGN